MPTQSQPPRPSSFLISVIDLLENHQRRAVLPERPNETVYDGPRSFLEPQSNHDSVLLSPPSPVYGSTYPSPATQFPRHCCPRRLPPSFIVDISSLLKSATDEEGQSTSSLSSFSRSESVLSSVAASVAPLPPQPRSAVPAKRPLTSQELPAQSPAKKQSKWSPEEDSKIIQLRQDGMKWEDISKHLPGRSAISCRLHYQNYLERRSEWDEDRKNKLARLYERFRADMWARVAEEMAMPWRAVEAMHWQMGEHEMAKRAGVTPFSLANVAGGTDSTYLPPRSQLRHGGPAPRLRRESGPHEAALQSPRQLPSLAELTAGLPAFSAPPQPSPDPFHHHHLYDHPKGRNSRFR